VDDARLVLDLVAGLASADTRRRQRTADEVTDVHTHLGDDDTSVLATVLVAARLLEGDTEAQEAQLHALTVRLVARIMGIVSRGRSEHLGHVHVVGFELEQLDQRFRHGLEAAAEVEPHGVP
jgi:hypothetical protein